VGPRACLDAVAKRKIPRTQIVQSIAKEKDLVLLDVGCARG